MLTGEGGERTILKAFRGGFSDFVSKKNLNLEELIGAIRGAVDRKNSDRSDRAEHNRLARRSGIDSLTGLNSSDFMTQRTQELVSTAVRRGGQFGVIVVRLGELESIGDRFWQCHARSRASGLCRAFAEDGKRGRYLWARFQRWFPLPDRSRSETGSRPRRLRTAVRGISPSMQTSKRPVSVSHPTSALQCVRSMGRMSKDCSRRRTRPASALVRAASRSPWPRRSPLRRAPPIDWVRPEVPALGARSVPPSRVARASIGRPTGG